MPMPIDISKFDRCHLLVVGDLMLDEYLWGDVDRISPEAPVQVVSIKNEEYALGGRVVLIPVTENISSTRIINNIKSSTPD
ncbi:MAG: hypothetical protein WBI57_09400 [Desulfobacterales bacterium]